MAVDSSILEAMMSPFTQGAVPGALAANYYNPTATQQPQHYNQGTMGHPNTGVAAGGGQGWGQYNFPTDIGNALNARGVQFGQNLRFLGDPRFSSLLNTLRSPLGNIGFQTNFGQSAGLAPTPSHA